MSQTIRIGTRGSDLALWQARHIADLLRQHYPESTVELNVYTTKGDTIIDKSLPEIGGKGLFTEELERALLAGEIDCAVHSLKDLPTVSPQGLGYISVPKRAAVEDVLISKHGLALDKLPEGAKIGTSSLRRAAQLRQLRPDFQIIDLRGNVPTRINKALDTSSPYDAIVLAQAGVERLGLMDKVSQIIPLDIMLPAPAQGAIAVEIALENNEALLEMLLKICDEATVISTNAERIFLAELQAGCSLPVAAYAEIQKNSLTLKGLVISLDGQKKIELSQSVTLTDRSLVPPQANVGSVPYFLAEDLLIGYRLGKELAHEALRQGAAELLAEAKA